jgi:hypothetical protein
MSVVPTIDEVTQFVASGAASTTALRDSTEAAQL